MSSNQFGEYLYLIFILCVYTCENTDVLYVWKSVYIILHDM